MNGVFVNQRGMTHHVEMVISFIMFIGFVLFVLLFVRSSQHASLESSTVELVFPNVVESFSDTIFVFAAELSPAAGSPCVAFDLSEFGYSMDYNSVAVFRNSVAVGSTLTGSRILLDRDSGLYTGVVANSLNVTTLGSGGCTDLEFSEYEIAYARNESVISYVLVSEMADLYTDNYDVFRSTLSLSNVFDIRIVVGDMVMGREIPQGVDVYSVRRLMPVLHSNGVIEHEEVVVTIWR